MSQNPFFSYIFPILIFILQVEISTTIYYNINMIKITVNGVDYNLPLEKLSVLLTWLQSNGATKVLESSNPVSNGRSLINE